MAGFLCTRALVLVVIFTHKKTSYVEKQKRGPTSSASLSLSQSPSLPPHPLFRHDDVFGGSVRDVDDLVDGQGGGGGRHEVPSVENRGARGEIVPLAANVRALVGGLVVAKVFDSLLGDDAEVDVGPRPQIVEDTRADGSRHQLLRLLLVQTFLGVVRGASECERVLCVLRYACCAEK